MSTRRAPGEVGPWLADARTSYDTVAEAYAELVPPHFAADPLLPALVEAFAARVHAAGGGPVLDVGCGPGHVTARLAALGLHARGLDLSPGMVARARTDHPGLTFEVGSMTGPLGPDASFGGILAFWSLIHVPDGALPGVLGGFRRALRDGAPLAVGMHLGDHVRRKTEGYGGLPMGVDVHHRPAERMVTLLGRAGFVVTTQVLLDLDSTLPGAVLLAVAS